MEKDCTETSKQATMRWPRVAYSNSHCTLNCDLANQKSTKPKVRFGLLSRLVKVTLRASPAVPANAIV